MVASAFTMFFAQTDEKNYHLTPEHQKQLSNPLTHVPRNGIMIRNGERGRKVLKDPGKLRLWRIAELLYKETDEHNMLSAAQINRILNNRYGLKSNSRTIHEDIRFLSDIGMNIETLHSTQNRYYISQRLFELPELQLLIDAVQSSHFVTEKKSKALTKKLLTLTNMSGAEQLRRHFVTMPDRKARNEQIYYIADTVSRAITLKKKISFQYYQYDARKRKKLKHDGEPYVFSPYSLVWNGDFYYVIGWCDTHGRIGSYRIERIYQTPRILDEDIIPPPSDFSPSEYVGSMFRMYNTDRETVTLLCDNSAMDTVIDHFGLDVEVKENMEGAFIISANVAVNHVFFRWVFGMSGDVKITAPEYVRQAYCQMVNAEHERLCGSL